MLVAGAAYYRLAVPLLERYLGIDTPVRALRLLTLIFPYGTWWLFYQVRRYARQRLTVERRAELVRFTWAARPGGRSATFEWPRRDMLGVRVGGGRREGRARRHLKLYATGRVVAVLPGWSPRDLDDVAARVRTFLGLPEDAQHPADVPPLAHSAGAAPGKLQLTYERPRVRVDRHAGGTTITLPPRARLNRADLAALVLPLLFLSAPLLTLVLIAPKISRHWYGLVIGVGLWIWMTGAIVWSVVGKLGGRTRLDVSPSDIRVTITSRFGRDRVSERSRDRVASVEANGTWINTRRKEGPASLLVVANTPGEADEVVAHLWAALEVDAAPAARTLSGDE